MGHWRSCSDKGSHSRCEEMHFEPGRARVAHGESGRSEKTQPDIRLCAGPRCRPICATLGGPWLDQDAISEGSRSTTSSEPELHQEAALFALVLIGCCIGVPLVVAGVLAMVNQRGKYKVKKLVAREQIQTRPTDRNNSRMRK